MPAAGTHRAGGGRGLWLDVSWGTPLPWGGSSSQQGGQPCANRAWQVLWRATGEGCAEWCLVLPCAVPTQPGLFAMPKNQM